MFGHTFLIKYIYFIIPYIYKNCMVKYLNKDYRITKRYMY